MLEEFFKKFIKIIIQYKWLFELMDIFIFIIYFWKKFVMLEIYYQSCNDKCLNSNKPVLIDQILKILVPTKEHQKQKN